MDSSLAGEEEMDRAHTVGTSDPWHDVLAAVAAFISGVRYGVKIRLPHALVMVVMFRRDLSTRGKLRAVMKAVMEHATSLASFAVIYKCTLALLRVLQRRYDGALRNDLREFMSTKSLGRLLMNMMVPRHEASPEPIVKTVQAGRPEQRFHALVAGALGGYFVWGRWSPISHQVLMYISIRVLAGLWKLLPVHDDAHWKTTHRLAATLSWAAVMYLWETSPDVLQSSMRKSMDEIYDSGLFERKRSAGGPAR